MIKYYYGVRNLIDLVTVIELVSDLFPASNKQVTEFALWGTVCAETLGGTYRDKTPESHGVGLTQIDKIAFDDIKARTRDKNKELIKEVLEIDINKVRHSELSRNPLLAVLFARLHYMLIPDPFPDNLEGMAEYWKQHYNRSGKGTPEKFIERCKESFNLFEKEAKWLKYA